MKMGIRLPAGWVGTGCTYSHPTGARVIRSKNPGTGLIEWLATHPSGREEYCGQDLHDALAVVTLEVGP